MKLATNPTLLTADGQTNELIDIAAIDDLKTKNHTSSSLLSKRSHRLTSGSHKHGKHTPPPRVNKVPTVLKSSLNGKVSEMSTHCNTRSRKNNMRSHRLKSKDLSVNSNDLKLQEFDCSDEIGSNCQSLRNKKNHKQ